MKKKFLGLALLLAQMAYAQDKLASQYAEFITPADLKDNLSIIASDAFEGRETGKRGQKLAAAFIANHFDELGLTAPINGSHYMPVELVSVKTKDAYVKVGTTQFSNYAKVIYSGNADSGGEVSLEAVFVGKGTDADYAYVNAKDKAIVVYIDSLSMNARQLIRKNAMKANEIGAKMLFIVAGGKADAFKNYASMIKQYMGNGSLRVKGNESNNPNKGTFLIDQTVAAKIFNTSFEKLSKAANGDAAKKPLSKIKPSRLVYRVEVESKQVKSENVLGYMEGTDKKDELIIISAHYDHIGISTHGEGDKINNGADDDGSGTVTVLQLAKAFAQAKKDGHGPRRSILFLTVTGEEKGLLGSEYYVSHPVYPLANTVADLNIDMVGRRDPQHDGKPDFVYVIGSDKLSSELHEINERNNKTYTHLDFDYTYNDQNHPDQLYYRSDHWNFAKNNVPIIFYFDGIHEDYHKPSDEVSKIDFDLLAKRGKAVFYTAWELVNRDNRITVDKK